MSISPVIICGGLGARLWPASRPDRPKPFLPLTGGLTLFQQTLLRAAPLADGGGRLVVAAGAAHRALALRQMAELELEAALLLEPEPRGSAAAVAAAALWLAEHAPDSVAAVLASDHHLPDAAAFRAAVVDAAGAALRDGIVTLGVRPDGPSAAYGYILPGAPLAQTRAFLVDRFVEKPRPAAAEALIADGCLWNSGNFIATPASLLAEFEAHAPDVLSAARAATAGAPGRGVIRLGEAFRRAPQVSIDYAVMEKTARASVLPVDFAWSDLGAWDAVARACGQDADSGLWVDEGSDNLFVRTAPGMATATVGLRDLAVVVEPDAVLVCDLARGEQVRAVFDRLKALSPSHVEARRPESLADRAGRFADWMRLSALPVWSSLGLDETGAFREALTVSGRPHDPYRRVRVQTRQIHVYATAGRLGWEGRWRTTAERAWSLFRARHLRPDGLYRTLTDVDGAALDDTPSLYDQAFVLFALAGMARAGLDAPRRREEARALLAALSALKAAAGGWREAGARPYQANAHMHLFEACLAWEPLDADGGWAETSDHVADLARRRFIDARTGALREVFDAEWSPAAGPEGDLVEPGHQFEWCWLLTRWGRSRGEASALEAARRLYEAGLAGIDSRQGVAVDELDAALAPRSRQARLWPQTEWLKAALILAEDGEAEARARSLEEAAQALEALERYLLPGGLWRDKLDPDGGFVDEPAPASSFYHLMMALEQLAETLGAAAPLGDGFPARPDPA